MNTKPFVLLLLCGALAALVAGCGSRKVQREPVASTTTLPKKSFKPRYLTRIPVPDIPLTFPGPRTVEDVLRIYGPEAIDRLAPHFKRAGVDYPPRELTLVGLKAERRLEVWAHDRRGANKLIRSYDIQAASGTRGPKLREGDRQVPEGVYQVVMMNPNSDYHLSMKLNYPNSFDRFQAALDGRSQLGGDIFIHGKAKSAGCLAMGDLPIEELFVLVSHVGKENVKVVIAPHDPRQRPLMPATADMPEWVPDLYRTISYEINQLQPTSGARAAAETANVTRRF